MPRYLCVALAVVIAGLLGSVPRSLQAEELTPEQLKQRVKELYEKVKESNDFVLALQTRVNEAETRTSIMQVLAEQFALRLTRYEKDASGELQGLLKPESMNRLAEPVLGAQEGDWVAYARLRVSADGKKDEETLKITVATKAEKKVTYKREVTREGKTTSEDVVYSGFGPIDPAGVKGTGDRDVLERAGDSVEAAGKNYGCMRLRCKYTPKTVAGKEGPSFECIYWINPIVWLTGVVKAEHFAANGDKTTYVLTGFGSAK